MAHTAAAITSEVRLTPQERASSSTRAGAQMVFQVRGVARIAPTGEGGRLRGRGSVPPCRVPKCRIEAVLGFLTVGPFVVRGKALHSVALLRVEREKGFEQAQRSAPVRNHVRDLQVDAVAVPACAQKRAFRVDVQAVADGQALAHDGGRLVGLLQVVPEHAAAQSAR